MKEELCLVYTKIVKEKNLSFSEAGKLSNMSKTQVNHIVNHEGKEVSLEKIINGLKGFGYKINFTLEIDE